MRKQLVDEKIALIGLACKNKEEANREVKKGDKKLTLTKFKNKLKLNSEE